MITGKVINAEGPKKALEALRPNIYRRMFVTLYKLGVELQRMVKFDKLSGQVLHNRTGTLRRSINLVMDPMGPADRIIAKVGTNVVYAAVHEYGFNGPVTVKAHMRRIKQAWGRPIKEREVDVKSYTRHMFMPERSYLRSSIKDMSGRIERASQLLAEGKSL